jgi:hypothetical protein
MLSREDLRSTFVFFKWITKVGIFPGIWDESDGKLRNSNKSKSNLNWRRQGIAFKIWQFLFLCHVIYIGGRTMGSISSRGFILEESPMMIIFAGSWISACASLYIIWEKWPELNVKLVNEFHRVHGQFGQFGGKLGKMRKWRNRSPEELLICFYPYMAASLIFCYPLMYLKNLNLPILIISAIPPQQRNFLIVFVCLLTDMTLHICFISYAVYGPFFVLSFSVTFTAWTTHALSRLQ